MFSERRFSPVAILVAGLISAAGVCSAQSVVSARSGTLHYFEGDVSIDGAPVQAKVSKFPEIKEQSVLSTGKGRAEILLTPGVFLRVGENSSIRMLDTRLIATRVDLVSGNAIVESDDQQLGVKDSPVTLLYKDYEIRMVKFGLLEVTSDPTAQMKVFKGEVEVSTGGSKVVVREGHLLPFGAALTTEKFDTKEGDDLYLWARDRSQNLSAANMSSARSISTGSCYVACNSGGAWNGGWYYNPYFDMITYVPGAGTFWNPFGYGYFSPLTIGNYYMPMGYWNGGGGARGLGVAGQTFGGGRLTSPVAASRTGISSGNTGGVGSFGVGNPSGSGGGLSGGGGLGSGGGGLGGGSRGGGGSRR